MGVPGILNQDFKRKLCGWPTEDELESKSGPGRTVGRISTPYFVDQGHFWSKQDFLGKDVWGRSGRNP